MKTLANSAQSDPILWQFESIWLNYMKIKVKPFITFALSIIVQLSLFLS